MRGKELPLEDENSISRWSKNSASLLTVAAGFQRIEAVDSVVTLVVLDDGECIEVLRGEVPIYLIRVTNTWKNGEKKTQRTWDCITVSGIDR